MSYFDKKISFHDLSFVPLSWNHDLTSFCCTDSDLNEFLIENARVDQQSDISLTWIVTYKEKIVGFLTLTNDSISRGDLAPEDGENVFVYPKYPALKIARLATHKDYEGRDIGTSMVAWSWAVALKVSRELTGCRIITVVSKYRSKGFYDKLGFKKAEKKGSGINMPMYRDNLC